MKRLYKLFFAFAAASLLVFGITTCKTDNEAGAKRSLTGLEITTPADRNYTEGQLFNTTNLVVMATYRNKPSKTVTNQCSFEPSLKTRLTTADTVIVISYTEDGFTLKAHHGITVRDKLEGGNPDPVVTGVTVSPSTIQVQKGTTFTFSAIVEGENNPSQEVTWTVEGGSTGTSITNGLLTVAAGETAATLMVKAASTVAGYTDIVGTAAVTVTDQEVVVTITDVTVSPPTVTMAKGGTHQFNAFVSGANAPQTVTWTVEGGSTGTNITTNGLLTVAADETAATLMVKAASTVAGYTDKVGTATVTVTSAPITYTVTFNSDGGSSVPTQTVSSGGTAAQPANPTRSGYTFDNWYTEATGGSVYNFNSPVTDNITLYARWTVIPTTTYTVTFNSNGGSSVPTQTVNSGGTAARPASPTRSGYTFDNWYTANTGGSVYNFSSPVTGNITVYARWTTGGSSSNKIAQFDAHGIRLGAFIRSTWGIPVALRPAENPGWAGGYEGWNPGWTAAQIKGEYLTDLMLAFALIQSDQQTISFSDSGTSINPPTHYLWNELTLLQNRYPHLRINLSIGGWNGPHFADMAKDSAKRAAFVTNCINFVRDKGLDGLDIDWEYPVTGGQYPEKASTVDADNWVILLRALREALTTLGNQTGKTYKLSACCPVGNQFINANKPQEAAQWVDSLTLMAYDMAGSWEPKALHAAPLYASPGMPASWSTDEAVTGYRAKGVPAQNIMVGFPAYGMGWTVASGLTGSLPGYNTGGPAFLSENDRLYDDIKKLVNQQGYTRYWDNTAKAPFLYNSSNGRWITYCDAQQVQEIAKYVKEKNLGGMFYWEYAGDWDTELLKAAYDALVAEYGL